MEASTFHVSAGREPTMEAAAAGVISDSLANSRTIKPFFSSTFSDFTAEREHLVRDPHARCCWGPEL